MGMGLCPTRASRAWEPRYNLRMQILSYLGLKLLLVEDILSDFSDNNCGQN